MFLQNHWLVIVFAKGFFIWPGCVSKNYITWNCKGRGFRNCILLESIIKPRKYFLVGCNIDLTKCTINPWSYSNTTDFLIACAACFLLSYNVGTIYIRMYIDTNWSTVSQREAYEVEERLDKLPALSLPPNFLVCPMLFGNGYSMHPEGQLKPYSTFCNQRSYHIKRFQCEYSRYSFRSDKSNSIATIFLGLVKNSKQNPQFPKRVQLPFSPSNVLLHYHLTALLQAVIYIVLLPWFESMGDI